MLGMGIMLTVDDFKRVLKMPRAVELVKTAPIR